VDFQLSGSDGAQEWMVPWVTNSPGLYIAEDRSQPVNVGIRLGYTLSCPRNDGCWFVLGVRNVSYEPSQNLNHLYGSHPNPANLTTTISFTINQVGPVEISVYDMAGRRMSRLTEQVYPVGSYSIEWNGRDSHGREVASETYFVRMTSLDKVESTKISIVR